MTDQEKTHFKSAFPSPYLGALDLTEPTVLTIARVIQEADQTKRSRETFVTAYFVEREIRPGEKLKPMILNATNCKTLKHLTGTPYLQDWQNVRITIYVEPNIKFGRDVVEGLRISPEPPAPAQDQMPTLSPDKKTVWKNAKAAYVRDGHLNAVRERFVVPDDVEAALIAEIEAEQGAET